MKLRQVIGVLAGIVLVVSAAQAQTNVRVRGTITGIDGKILSVKSRTSYSLTGGTGKTRLAWIVIGRRPVVQCVQVRRSGNAVAGIEVRLLSLSAPQPLWLSGEGEKPELVSDLYRAAGHADRLTAFTGEASRKEMAAANGGLLMPTVATP